MRAIELECFGIENLRVVEVDDPEPAPGQILVKFGATSVKALGADHAINYATTPTRGDMARELTGGLGVDAVTS